MRFCKVPEACGDSQSLKELVHCLAAEVGEELHDTEVSDAGKMDLI